MGLKLRRPICSAVGSPSLRATSPCATSWKTMAITSGTSQEAISKTILLFIPKGWGAAGRPSSLRAGKPEAELARFAFLQALVEMLAAQRDIAVVATDLGLRAGRDGVALGIDAQVHRRLAPAFAHRFQFDQAVGEREQRSAALEEVRLEVGTQPVAEDGNAHVVADPAQLEHMVAGQELGFVDQHAVELAPFLLIGDRFEQIDLGGVIMRRRRQSDARTDHSSARAV